MGISDRFPRRTDSARRTGARRTGRGRLLGGGIAVSAVGALAATALAGAGSALAAGQPATGIAPAVAATPPAAGGYQFVEIGSHHDRTFNQLLGINDNGRIAGYYGSGAKGHRTRAIWSARPTLATPW